MFAASIKLTLLKIKIFFLTFKFWFFILVLINALPIFIFQYYPNLDGPTHLYNANLLKEIIVNRNEHIQQFFELNHELIPNWTSHAILFFLKLFFTPAISNKILLLIIGIGLPLSIYSFITRISPENKLLTVFSLPFVYTYLFGLGFYNYCLSVILLFITLNYWINNKNNRLYIKISVMFLLVTLTYFSHIYLYVSLIIAVFCYTAYRLISHLIFNEPDYKKYIIDLFLIMAISLPTLVLLYKFLIVRGIPSINTRFTFHELLNQIVNVRPLIIHNYIDKIKYTRIIFYLVLVLLAYSTFKFLIEIKHTQIKQLIKSVRTYLFLITLVFIGIFFVYNNPKNDGGYIPVRIGIIMFLFLFCWLSSLNYPGFLKVLSFITILIINFILLHIEYKSIISEDKLAKKFVEASSLIEENSTILPIREYNHMVDLHFPHLMAVNKAVVVLENYEASSKYFPIVWNLAELPKISLGDTIISSNCSYTEFKGGSDNESIIDYAIVWGRLTDQTNECKRGLMDIIEKNYYIIYYSQDPTVILFKIKPEFYD